jgi:methionine-rich copper-binding protein CopC
MNGSRRGRRVTWLIIPTLVVLIVGVLLLTGCEITSLDLPTNVEAGTHYTMVVTINSGSSSGFTGRMVLSIRVPNQWTVSSTSSSGAVTGSLTYSSTITGYFGTTWESESDASHNGPKSGYKWYSYYTAPVTGVSPTDDAVITIVLNTHGQSGNFLLDLVPGFADSTSPTVPASNNGGTYWEGGTPQLDRPITLLATVKPFVTATNPPAGAVNVATSASPTVTFSESMDPSTLGGNVYVQKNGGGMVAASYSYNVATKTATVDPAADLDPSTDYQIVVKAAVADAAGNTMGADYVVGFTTAAPAAVAPQVTAQSPAPGTTGVAVGTAVTATFDEDMDATTVNDGTYYLMEAGSPTKVPAVVTYVAASKQAVIDPVSDLDASTQYTVNLTAGMKGANGLSVQGAPITWTFTTAAPAAVAPQVTQKLPADGATGVAVGSSVSAVFDEDINAATLTNTSFTLTKSGSATAVPATVSYVGGTKTAMLAPTADLEPNTLYNVTLTGAVLGANGLAVQGAPVTWSFTTAAAALTFPDVPPSYPFYNAIQGMADLGIINGYTNGNFGPNDPVRRWQFAKMIVGALSLPISESDSATPPFTDLDPDNPSALDMTEYVAVAYKNGITTGVTATTFGPYTYISRTQVVTMVVRAVQGYSSSALATPPAGYQNTWGTGYSSIHGPLARIAEYNGLLAGIDLTGVANNPYSQMPRGEVAQILWNMMALLNLR